MRMMLFAAIFTAGRLSAALRSDRPVSPGLRSMQVGGNSPTDRDDVYNVIIRNVKARCAGGHGVIRLLCQDGIRMHHVVVSNVTDTTDYPILRDILITRNRFRDNCGVAAYLSSVRNVTVCRNLIEDPTPRRKEKPYRSQFYLTHAADVRIVDNVYRPSSNVKSPGVAWDPETCSGIVTEGNRIR